MTDPDHICDHCTNIPCCRMCNQVGVRVIDNTLCSNCGVDVIWKKPSELGWTKNAS